MKRAALVVLLLVVCLAFWWTRRSDVAVDVAAPPATIARPEARPVLPPVSEAVIEAPRSTPEREVIVPTAAHPEPAAAADHDWYFRILEAGTHRPVAGASATTQESAKARAEASADEQGYLILPHVSPRRRFLWYIDAPGFARSVVAATSGGATRETACEIELLRCASLHVRLIDKEGRPIPQGYVDLTASIRNGLTIPVSEADFKSAFYGDPNAFGGHRSGLTGRSYGEAYEWTARADANGEADFACLPPNLFLAPVIVVEKKILLEPDPFMLAPGARQEITWSLPREATVVVELVREDGAPVAGRDVWVVRKSRDTLVCNGQEPQVLLTEGIKPDASAVTDSNGIATLTSVAEGDAYIGPAPRRVGPEDSVETAFAPVATLVHFDESTNTIHVRIECRSALFVAGRAIDDAGVPQVGLRLWLSSPSICRYLESKTDDAGRFSMGPLLNAPTTLSAMGGGVTLAAMEVRPGDLAVVVRIPALVSFHVTIAEPGSSTLLPIESVRFHAERNDFETSVASASTVFTCTSVPIGEYSLVAITSNGKIGVMPHLVVSKETANASIRLDAEPVEDVQIQNGGEGWLGVRAFVGPCLIEITNVKAHDSTWLKLPCGSVRIEMSAGRDSKATRTFELARGSPVTVQWP